MPVIVWSRILPLALQSFILITMLKRKLRPEFPLFFLYTLINCFALCAAIVLSASPIQQTWFPYMDWAVSLMSMFIAFGVLYEVFVNTLKPYSALMDLGRMLFRWTAAVVFVAAVITVFATISIFAGDKRPALGSFESIRLLVDHSVRLMQCGLLFLLLLFEKRLGLSWRSRGIAIALGVGSSAAVALAVSFLKGFMGSATYRYDLDLINGGFYVAVTLFWAVTLIRPEAHVSNLLQSPNRVVAQRWNDALSTPRTNGNGELAFSPVDMFMPGIESVVERVLARKTIN